MPTPLTELLADELKKFATAAGKKRAVVGLSGGVDSAVTLAIGVTALGKENLTGLILPQAGLSSPVSAKLAREVADQLGVQTETVEIGAAVETLKQSFSWNSSVENDVADQNIAPRIRMAALYHFARAHDALVLGTSNKSEILLGYGTKWGDFAADVEVLGGLYKTEVFELAKELKIPLEIIDRPPTAELAVGVTDESELGASYEKLDAVLRELEENDFSLQPDNNEFVQKVLTRVQANRHKTELPPVLGLDR